MPRLQGIQVNDDRLNNIRSWVIAQYLALQTTSQTLSLRDAFNLTAYKRSLVENHQVQRWIRKQHFNLGRFAQFPDAAIQFADNGLDNTARLQRNWTEPVIRRLVQQGYLAGEDSLKLRHYHLDALQQKTNVYQLLTNVDHLIEEQEKANIMLSSADEPYSTCTLFPAGTANAASSSTWCSSAYSR